MKVYYRGSPIGEVSSKEEAKKFIENYQNEVYGYYHPLIEESKKLIDESSMIRNRKRDESVDEYLDSLRKTNKDFIEKLETLGKKLYKDDYIDIFFYRPNKSFFGFVVKHDNEIRNENIENYGLKACTKLAVNTLFEVKDWKERCLYKRHLSL